MLTYDYDFNNISAALINKPIKSISIHKDFTYVYSILGDTRIITGNINLLRKINKYLEEKIYNENCI